MSLSRIPGITAALAALGLATTAAFAQPGPGPGQPQGPGGMQPPGAQQPPPNGGPPSVGEMQRAVFAVTNVEVVQSGNLTALRVRGVVSSPGWQGATLVPLSRGTPSDGVLDVVMVAEAPSETMPAAGFMPVEGVLLIAENHPYRGVRVRSATNVLAVRALPGRAEAAPPAEDCRSCVGRTLGGAGGISREALPAGTRILMPTSPFPDGDPNPNRLTVLLGDDGKITEAMWQ